MFPFALPLFFWFTIDFFVEEVIISSYLSRLIMKEFPSIEKLDLIYHWYYFKPYFILPPVLNISKFNFLGSFN
jgi:hypothetical protein